MKRLVTIFLLMMLSIPFSREVIFAQKYSQQLYKKDSVKILFKFDNSKLDKTYRSNEREISTLDSILKSNINDIDSIYISSRSSIEGNEIYNTNLSQRRSRSLENYIKTNYSNLSNIICIDVNSFGEDWEGLYNYIYGNDNLPYRNELLAIINDKGIDNSEKEIRIKSINNGAVSSLLSNSMYWNSRNATAVIFIKNKQIESIKLIPINCAYRSINNIDITKNISANYSKCDTNNEVVNLDNVERMDIRGEKKPLLALKTNLLFDLATFLNFEIEVPIKKRFSVAGEFIFPFWKSNNADFTLETLNANLDIKYWFGNRENKEIMTGWNAGIYGGYGKFDYQFFSRNGVQGNFFNVGIGAGYAHSIAKNLRLEYSLGLGLIRSDYHKYKMVKETNYGDIKVVSFPWNKFYNSFLGPTKAKISLVWLINYRSSK